MLTVSVRDLFAAFDECAHANCNIATQLNFSDSLISLMINAAQFVLFSRY